MGNQRCRSCGATLEHTFVDLGLSPISNALVRLEDADKGDTFYPLHARVCHVCWLVQLNDVVLAKEHFNDDYVYFSSFSSSWLEHARHYVENVRRRLNLTTASKVIEIASNDGYLLQYFVKADIPCLGIEPTANTAAAAREKGVESREVFFGSETARELAAEGWTVDLLLGNNVLAHVPDINDFVAGMPLILKPQGVITLEFPHLLQLIAHNEFDTLYHEHYSYLSLTALLPIFQRAGMRVFDVEHLPTHGGSLRLFVCHQGAMHVTSAAVARCLDQEVAAGLTQVKTYAAFAETVRACKRDLLSFLIDVKRRKKRIAGYGAAAKGNTLLNYCGIGADFIDYVVDRNPAKQNRLLPGSRIPVHAPEVIFETQPDYVLILPWNIHNEITAQMDGIRAWGGQFVIPIPKVGVLK
ncbi:MAG: class I SAM-dependent methyltransferase [Pseudomonadota bacterium]|nr:class I SAM-dependent methyltransferase [Pseudomonadota bacterium]